MISPSFRGEDTTESPTTDGGQVADEVTELTVTAEEVVTARPEQVWDLVADVTRVGEWSQECIRAAWLEVPGRPRPGARFTGRNWFANAFEYEVTCVVTEAERPRAFAWVVPDDSGDPARPSSSWRYLIEPLPAAAGSGSALPTDRATATCGQPPPSADGVLSEGCQRRQPGMTQTVRMGAST